MSMERSDKPENPDRPDRADRTDRPDRFEGPILHGPLDQLERALIDEYVRGRGYDPQALADLDDDQRHVVLVEASIYASSRLTEVESRSRFIHDMHDGAGAPVPVRKRR